MGGGTIVPRSLRTKGNKKSYMTPLYWLKIVFPIFYPLTATGMAFCVDLGSKCQNLFCLLSD
jgi:hypothetical protein